MNFFIKEARERTGLNQKDFASSLGIPYSTFNGYETGQHDPKSEILVKIAVRCNVSVDFLLGLTDNPNPQYNMFEDEGLNDIVKSYDSMNKEGRDEVCKIVKNYASLPCYQKENQFGLGA